MKVMVTGAAGFLGSHLMLHHLRQGDAVLGVDNFASSRVNSSHVAQIEVLGKAGQGVLLTGDIASERDLWGCFSSFEALGFGNQIDLIYNFACPASPPVYQAMPIETMKTCTAGVINVLEMARQHRSVIVHASTSEVYGDPTINPQVESYRGCVNSYGPRACYDEGKRAAEALCYDYHKVHGVDARLVRIFNTFGPNMDPDDGRVISNFICQALKGERLTIYGSGAQTRSFCYVDDLIRGIVATGALARNPLGPINLGNPREFTVNELAARVIYIVNAFGGSSFDVDLKPWVDYRSLPVDDPLQRCPDITRAREVLAWQPQVGLEEGLDRTIGYFRSVAK